MFSYQVVSDSLWPQELQHARLPCLSLSPRVCSDWVIESIESVMLSNYLILCHPLLLLPSIFSSIRVFPMSWLFPLDGQSIGASASASVLPMNNQGWFPLGLTGLISLLSKRFSRVFSSTTNRKYWFFVLGLLKSPTLTFVHDY